MSESINPREFRPSRTVAITSVDTTSGRTAKRKIPYNKKVGHLKIGPNRPIGRDKRIYTACDCGRSTWIPAADLEKMVSRRGGCGSEDCSALSFVEAVWDSPDAIRIQLFALLIVCPEDVQSSWGGTSDDVYEVSFEEAVENLYAYLSQSGYTGLWLQRKDAELPFMESNVRLGTRPDIALSGFSKAKVEVDGVMMSMKELCTIGNVNASTLLIKMYKLGTTDDLLFHIMED